jgi:hypothetical protein
VDAADAVHAARLTAQGLAGDPATSVDAVVERLLAVQGQDGRGFRLAVRARSAGLAASDVDRALAERRLVVSWVNRGTLHLVRSQDWPWLHALTTPQLRTGNARRLQQEGVDPAAARRGVDAVRRALQDGPRTRAQLREVVASADVPVAGQALVHVLMLATLEGVCVRGPVVEGEQAFVPVGDWLGPPPVVDRDRALAELAVRYLAGHGPADGADLARWAGLTLGAARRALRSVADRLVELPGGLLDLPGHEPAPLPAPRLLGPFDPVLLGWCSREPVTGRHTGLVTVNGIFKAFALVEGRAAATWGYAAGRVTVTSLEPYGADVVAALQHDAQDVERYLTS